MFNTLKQMQETLSEEELIKHGDALLEKSIEEIEEYFKENNIEVSKQCIKECFDYLKGTGYIAEDDLDKLAGGIVEKNGSLNRLRYTAPCASCGETAYIPFPPVGDRAVYCQECWARLRNNS